MSSSEERFGIPKQPYNTCPDIDGLLSSIKGIGEYDEEGDLIEISPDYKSWSDAQSNVEELKLWQEEWINIGEELIERLTEITDSISKYEDEEELTYEQEAYVELFMSQDSYLRDLKEELSDHLQEWRKTIKSDFWDLEYQYSAVITSVDNNEEDASKEIESYRSLVSDFRTNGNYFKEKVRDNALVYLPEKIDEPSFTEQYEEKIEKIEAEKLLKTMNELGMIKEEKDKPKNRIKLK